VTGGGGGGGGEREDGKEAAATGKKHGHYAPDLSRCEIRSPSKPAMEEEQGRGEGTRGRGTGGARSSPVPAGRRCVAAAAVEAPTHRASLAHEILS
jgi:hypothetical protein